MFRYATLAQGFARTLPAALLRLSRRERLAAALLLFLGILCCAASLLRPSPF